MISKRVVCLTILCSFVWFAGACYAPSLTAPTPTPEPLIPTVPPALQLTATPSGTAVATAVIATPVGTSGAFTVGGPDSSRICVGVPGATTSVSDFDWNGQLPGWWLNWHVLDEPPPGPPFAQMVRTKGYGFYPDLATVKLAARRNPGALWLLGNEMDVEWQDNATPEEYAKAYNTLYDAIKSVDPSAKIAIGGISQPTPMRLKYLDSILEAYRAQTGRDMPVDVWNVHAFILREERDSWGVGIPPGTAADQGELREIEDHTDMTIFKAQILRFREWMAERGFRDKPLIVSEYGVLMPAEYGFPPEAVEQFMRSTFEFFLSASDERTGYPADADRLVQAFCWFSAADTVYPTSNLFDPTTHAQTELGAAFEEYLKELAE